MKRWQEILREMTAGYDSIVGKYHSRSAHFSPHLDFADFIARLPCPRVLEVGCGTGRDGQKMADAVEYLGFDISLSMVHHARNLVTAGSFICADLLELPFKPVPCFGGIWCSATLLHVPKKWLVQVLSSFRRILYDDGIIYLTVKKGTGESFDRDHRYGGIRKYWSYFSMPELEGYLVELGFGIIDGETTPSLFDDTEWLWLLAKK